MASTLSNSLLQIRPSRPTVLPSRKASKPSAASFRPLSITCRKKDIHPEFYEDAKVYCNGELVMTTGGTQKSYTVDVWSGNHPFFLGDRSTVQVEADQVEKFRRRYGTMTEFMQIPVLKGEIVLPPKRKGAGKGKKK